jgi:hypothetical protein
MTVTAESIDGRVMIPELLRALPQARPVLDRYGLRGCGGKEGPVESLAFFASAHDVPLPKLLEELREACRRPAPETATPPDAGLADAIYRPFFKSGIILVLTLGATWGAYLLWQIGFQKLFTAVGIHEINAHGHAQIFGWVGLFVMGFAYQAFPRFKHTSLSHPRLALATLVLMLTGILVRSLCEPLQARFDWLAAPAVAASALEVVAIVLFVGVLAATWRACGRPLAVYDWYILSALAWFVAQAIYETIYVAATFAVTNEGELVAVVARWQGALREMQIHGFALLMILGVSQRLFHHFYGFPAPSPRVSLAALVALNAAIVAEVLASIFMRSLRPIELERYGAALRSLLEFGSGSAWRAVWYASVLLLAGTVVVLVRNWGIFGRPRERDRSLKFLRTAYVWLFVSLAMLVVFPFYQYGLLPWLAPESKAVADRFSHAYYGAVRHAITVGFISLMIVGVAAKVVPTLNGVDVRRLSSLWLPFLLVNAGCTLRVVGQTLTDFTAAAFPVAGVSGVLEVSGLALWGGHLWAIMAGRARLRSVPLELPLEDDAPIAAGHRVGHVLERYPGLLDTFLTLGFRPLANPILRRTVARLVTIEQACRQESKELGSVLAALNAARARATGGRRQLPVVDPPTSEALDGTCCPSCARPSGPASGD